MRTGIFDIVIGIVVIVLLNTEPVAKIVSPVWTLEEASFINENSINESLKRGTVKAVARSTNSVDIFVQCSAKK